MYSSLNQDQFPCTSMMTWRFVALICDEDNCCIYEKLVQITHSPLTSMIGYNRGSCMGVSSLSRMYMTTLFADVIINYDFVDVGCNLSLKLMKPVTTPQASQNTKEFSSTRLPIAQSSMYPKKCSRQSLTTYYSLGLMPWILRYLQEVVLTV